MSLRTWIFGLLVVFACCEGVTLLHAEEIGPGERRRIERDWLQGRYDRIATRLAPRFEAGPAGSRARDVLPLALRDLWWRPTVRPTVAERYRAIGEASDLPGYRRLYRQLLEGVPIRAKRGPQPGFQKRDPGTAWSLPAEALAAAAGEDWPVLTAVVLDRFQRENAGARLFRDESPLNTLDVGEDVYVEYALKQLRDDRSFHYGKRSTSKAQQKRLELARSTGERNAWLAIAAIVVLLLVPAVWMRILGNKD